jgi:hypothetical protein
MTGLWRVSISLADLQLNGIDAVAAILLNGPTSIELFHLFFAIRRLDRASASVELAEEGWRRAPQTARLDELGTGLAIDGSAKHFALQVRLSV